MKRHTQLTRLSGFAGTLVTGKPPNLSGFSSLPASVLTRVGAQAHPPPLLQPLPAPGGHIPTFPPQISQPCVLLSSPSPRPGIKGRSSKIPGLRRLNPNSPGSRNPYTPEVLGKGAGPQNPDPTRQKDFKLPALQSPEILDSFALAVLRCTDARPEKFRDPLATYPPPRASFALCVPSPP